MGTGKYRHATIDWLDRKAINYRDPAYKNGFGRMLTTTTSPAAASSPTESTNASLYTLPLGGAEQLREIWSSIVIWNGKVIEREVIRCAIYDAQRWYRLL